MELRVYDVVGDPAARARLVAIAEERPLAGVPVIRVGDTVLVGFDEPETTGVAVERALAGEEVIGPDVGVCGLEAEAGCPGSVRLPLVGVVDVDRVGLPAFTVAVGLVDGFNPCATWVLLLLLSVLVHVRDRVRMALIAGTFVLVSGLVYYVFLAAWLNLALVLGLARGVQIALGLLAVAVGALHVKDFFAFRRGPSLSIPDRAKPGIAARIRRVLHAEDLGGALAAAATLAVLVNFVELLCTAGLPALYTEVLIRQGLPPSAHYAWLLLYIAAYVFDDALMVTVAVVTLTRTRLQERGGRWLKLLSGAFILALGLLFLFWPEGLAF